MKGAELKTFVASYEDDARLRKLSRSLGTSKSALILTMIEEGLLRGNNGGVSDLVKPVGNPVVMRSLFVPDDMYSALRVYRWTFAPAAAMGDLMAHFVKEGLDRADQNIMPEPSRRLESFFRPSGSGLQAQP